MRRFFRILRYAKPYRLGLALGVVCVILVAGVNLIQPPVYAFVIGVLLPNAAKRVHTYTWHPPLVGWSITLSDLHWLAVILLVILSLNALSGFLSFARTYLMSWLGERLLFDIRNQVFLRLQELPMQF